MARGVGGEQRRSPLGPLFLQGPRGSISESPKGRGP